MSQKKIQTFAFVPPKSDIFLDLKQKPPSSIRNGQIELTLDRPTPKLLIDQDNSSLSNIRKQVQFLRTKCRTFRGTISKIKSSFIQNTLPKLSYIVPLKFWGEVVLSNLIGVVTLPIFLLWVVLLLVLRGGVELYLKLRFRSRYTLMSGTDAWGQCGNNCFTCLQVLEGVCNIDKIREQIKTLIGQRSEKFCEKMRWRIVQKCGFFCWDKGQEDLEVDWEFDIRDHVTFLSRDKAKNDHEMGEDEVLKLVDKPLAKDKPQWEVLVVPNFLYRNGYRKTNYYAVVWRVNHSLIDGISGVNLMQHLADKEVTRDNLMDSSLTDNWTRTIWPYLHILLFGTRSLLKWIVGKESHCFSIDTDSHCGQRTLVHSRPMSVQTLKQIKNVMSSSTTTVLLSAFGGSLRSLGLKKNLPVPDGVVGKATWELPGRNRVGVTHFRLPVGFKEATCPTSRLRSTADSLKEFGNVGEIFMNFCVLRLLGMNPVVVGDKLGVGKATFLLSSLKGPTETWRMFQGEKVVDVVAWDRRGRSGVYLCLFSYGGKIRAGIGVDEGVLQSPGDVKGLVQDFEEEVVQLAKVCGIPEEFVFLEYF